MVKRFALGALALSTLAIAVAYAAAFLRGGPPAWAAWLLALGTATCMVALMALGASRADRPLGALVLPLAATLVLVAGGFALALLLPPERAGDALWLGLPRRAAIVLYGIGLLPILVLPLAYAWTFDRLTLSEEDLERVRMAAAAMRGDAALGSRHSALGSGASATPSAERRGPSAESALPSPRPREQARV